MSNELSIRLAPVKPADVMIFEYGVLLDESCEAAFREQVFKGRLLYNALVAIMRNVVGDIRRHTLAAAGSEAAAIVAELEVIEGRFKAARAANDEAGMKASAQARRDARRQLYPLLSATRKAIKAELAPIYARVGKASSCETYQARCAAVDDGLGWATANAVLDAAMTAWKKTIALGNAPQFAVGSEKTQDSLTLQFTAKGGLPSAKLLAGGHAELDLRQPKKLQRRRYDGSFAFRLGPATAKAYATGSIEMHMPLPENSHVGMARLVSKRMGTGFKRYLQLVVKLAKPVSLAPPPVRAPMVAVHFGWSDDISGRRVAGYADGADPGFAQLLKLPLDIERDLDRSNDIRARRDLTRNDIVAAIKAHDFPTMPDALEVEVRAIRKLKPEWVTKQRLHRLSYALSDEGVEVLGLTAWRKEDRKQWQAEAGIARRARLRRNDHFRGFAKKLVAGYEVIVIEPLNLAEAAEKIDKKTGDRSEFTASARRGRFVSGLHDLRQAILWECTKTSTPLVELSAPTVSECVYCQDGTTFSPEHNHQELHCRVCGAISDRKLHGAARAWSLVEPHRIAMAEAYREAWDQAVSETSEKREIKAQKLAEGRRKAREAALGVQEPAQGDGGVAE